MQNIMLNLYIMIKTCVDRTLKDESGEASIIAIILVILAVIALAAIFKTQMTDIVNTMFTTIKEQLGI